MGERPYRDPGPLAQGAAEHLAALPFVVARASVWLRVFHVAHADVMAQVFR